MPHTKDTLILRLSNRLREVDWLQAVVANLLVISVLLYAKALRVADSDLFYRSVQEDEALEWATFWAFMAAAVAAVLGAVRQHKAGVKIPWFLAGVGLFCFVVAMEEISWGQRLLGYRPPVYFLEQNFQQELNFHNVFSTSLRKLGLKSVILGYGVGLPLMSMVPAIGRWFDRLAIVPPPWTLIPSFLAIFFTYVIYPWSFSGEIVELMLGLAFLFALLVSSRAPGLEQTTSTESGQGWLGALKAYLLIIALGAVTSTASQALTRQHPARLDAARVEVEALRQDFLALPEIRCSTHKRIYTYVRKYKGVELLRGTFSELVSKGLPEERASFFLDPWNSPYWVRHVCSTDGDTSALIVYSFGPNRKRDSTRVEVLGDDIAALLEP